jgi:hypothetical protein
MNCKIFEKLKKGIFVRVFFSVYLLILLLPLAKASVVLNATDFIGFNISASEIARIVSNGLIVSGGWVNSTNAAFNQICLSNDCRSSWPAGGGALLNPWDNSTLWIFVREGYPLNVNISNILFINYTSGNVGIGTTSPTQKLTVIGNINTTGSIITPANISIGINASALGSNAIAIGLRAIASATYFNNTAIGVDAKALNNNTVAIGNLAISFWLMGNSYWFLCISFWLSGATALGVGAEASGIGATALGVGAEASGIECNSPWCRGRSLRLHSNSSWFLCISFWRLGNSSWFLCISLRSSINSSWFLWQTQEEKTQ